ncbi:uncharacterized protein RB166_012054 [Leptodactylus fuscus]
MSSSSSSSSDVKSSVGKDTTIIGNLPNQLPKADVKVNASLQVGGSTGLGVQGGVGIKEYDEEEKRIQAELRKISEQKQSSAGVSVAVAERGGKIIQQEATSGEKKENSDGIQLGNLQLGGSLGHQSGQTIHISGQQEIQGGFEKSTVENRGKTVGFGVIGKKKSGNDDSSEDNNGSKKSNINVEGNLNGRVSVSHETSSIGIESGKHVNINVNGGGKDSSGDISKEVKGTINVGGKIGQNHVSGEANRKIDINIKRGHADHSEEDSSEEDSTDGKKGTIKVGGRIGQNHGSGEANRKIDINIKKAHTDHSEEDSSEGKKGTIKVGGKSGQNHVSGEANRKIDINIKRGHADHSEEDSSEEDSSGGKKGTIKVGGKSGQNHVSGEANRKIDINIKRGHTDHSEEDSSEEDSTDGKKGTIKVGGKIGQNHVSGEANRKIDINIKKTHTDHSEKDSSEEDSTDGKKGTIKVGGKSGQNHVSGEANRKIDINIKRGHTDHSEEDSSEEDSSSGKKGSINVGGKIVKNHGSKEQNEKIHINIKGGSSEQSKEDNSGENKGTSKSAKHESSKENKGKQNEPKEPVNPPKPVEPKEPVNPPKPVEPKEPVTPSKPAKPEEPNPATVPSSRESCTFNTNSVPHGWTAELDCASCTCNDGDLTCVKKLSCSGICSVTGFQMIRTFDGTLYESPGDCSYILVKTPDFTISLSNALCSELGGNKYDEHAVCIKSVDIYIPSKANLRLLYTGEILASGEATTLPYSILDTITVLRSSSTFLDVASPLFNLQYDFNLNRLYVILEVSYKGQTSGLCGTYNDNRNDDYRSSNDITETVSSFFSKSWKTQYQCSESKQQPEDNDRKVNADVICTDALESSIFEDCTLLIDIHSYKSSCVNSFYNNEEIGLCSALADYAYHCAQAGIFVPVSSSFPDCSPVCEGEMVFATENTFSQQDCAEFTSTLRKITSSLPLNEACVCPPDLYYDSSLNACVPGDSCPCYNNNRLYKIGETITQANGQTCPCERLLQCGDEEEPPADVEDCSEHEVYSDCFVGTGKACEPTCNNLALFDQGCTLPCQPGCICKSGLLRNNNGDCVPLNQCPCMHGDDIYNAGETLAQGCNTCTCENGKFSCTTNPCNKVCNAYGGSQFLLFDDVWKTFATRDCAIVLVESRKGESPFFKVVMRNDANEALGGALLKKKIYIGFGGASVLLSEFDTTVVHELGSTTQLRTYRSGFYVVVHFLEGLTVYYDQHLDVIIQLEPQLQGKVQGMCGDADGTTTSEQAINNMAQYASQFLVDECPNHEATKPPPTDNQKKFVEERCNLLKSEDFSECHTVVNVDPYYTACVEETESCREGESCLCYCTSLAAYARACCRKGITIEWRSPDTCPSPCEYYNRDSGKGPYRLLMMNSKTLVVDYDHQTVSLDTVDTTGNLKASFMVTPSLYVDPQNGRKLISLESAEHHNYFIVQNDDGSLSLQKWQPSVEFRRKATFVLRPDRWVKGFNALESFLARGQYLSLDGDELVMSKVKTANMLQMSFQLIEETFGLPSFSICTWKYRACGNPCIPTCQDPLGTKCTLTLKVEGCYPMCAPGMVFDEVTNRCVQLEDCITVAIGTTPAPAEICTHVTCKVDPCAEGEYLQEVPSTDPCCPQYICLVLSTLPPLITTPECKNVKCKVDSCAHGEYLQQIDTKDRCCPHFVCIGTTTPIPKVVTKESCKDVICTVKKCSKGQYLQQVSTSDPCCPSYECIEHPTVVAPTKTTIPQSNESCENVLCEPPARCTKNGAVLVEVQWADDCCPHYKCQCEVDCKPPPTCRDSVLPLRIGNPDVDCCPTYVCIYQPPTSAPASTIKKDCEDISCTVIDCDKNSRLVEVPSENPCCQAYECVPIVTTVCDKVVCKTVECLMKGSRKVLLSIEGCCPTYDCECDPCSPPPFCDGDKPIMRIDPEHECCPTYTCQPVPPTSCEEIICHVPVCRNGEKLIVKTNSDDPCCPLYDCIKPPTPPPTPGSTTVNVKCEDHACPVVDCFRKGSFKEFVGGNDPCCPEFRCVCQPCSPVPNCGDFSPMAEFDPDRECCPTYTCPTPAPQIKTTTPLITTPPTPTDICKNVLCEPVVCTKKGATVKASTWADQCCPRYTCECSEFCDPPPKCEDGSPAVRTQDPESYCCPEYECRTPTTTPSTTTTKSVCDGVTCTVPSCGADSTLIEVYTDDPCCRTFECLSHTTTVSPHMFHFPTPPPEICTDSKCDPANCDEDATVIVKPNPDNECCSIYECRYTTTPSPTTTTTPGECSDVVCTVKQCTKEGESPVFVGWENHCCGNYECQCEPCKPSPYCDGDTPIVKIDTDTQCCPSYECPNRSAPPEECSDVVCTVKECTKEGETLVFVGWENHCCGNFECQCEPCHPPPYCNGQIPLASINTDRECCPTYECPIPPTPPPELPSTTILHTTSRSITCVNRVCAPKICKEHEKLVTRINPSDPCCPIQTCECSCDTIPACADDEQLVAVQQSKQCCPKLKCERKRDECHIVPIHVNIKSGKCSAKVILSSCSGYCHSSTKYSKFWTPVSQCRCCSVTETRPKTFELPCSDGTKVHKTVHEATQCGCNTCSEDEGIPSGYHSGDHSGSGSGSGDEGSGFTMWSPFEYRNSI